MTRLEFDRMIEEWEWYDFVQFCYENDLDSHIENIVSEDQKDDDANEMLVDLAREETWQTVLSTLEDIPSGYDYYRYDGGWDWEALGDWELDSYIHDLARDLEDSGFFEPEEEDEEEDEPVAESESEPPLEPEDFSIEELFASGVACIEDAARASAASAESRKAEEEQEVRQEEEDWTELLFAV